MRKTPLAIATAVAATFLALAGCQSSSHAGAAKSAAAAVTANPVTAAELHQAKMLVESCVPASPLEQAQMVRLVFLSSASGKHGPEVTAARTKLGTCLGISKADEKPFFNDAVIAAEHGHLVRGGHAARVQYFEVALPQLVLKYGGTAAGMGTSTAQPSVPGTSVSATPAATAGSPA